MKWKIKDGLVLDEIGNVVVILPTNGNPTVEKIVEVAPEALDAIQNFVSQVNAGVLRPRSAVKQFEKVLERFNS